MRLITPTLEVGEEDAFDSDELGRERYGMSLLNIVLNNPDPMVISIDGEWGEGKTTFVKMWMGLLKKNGVQSIYIDAFSNDYVDDAFVVVARSINSYVRENLKSDSKKIADQLIDQIKRVGSSVLPLSTRIVLRAISYGVLDNINAEHKDDISKEISSAIGDVIGEKIERHRLEEESITKFRETLSSIPSLLGNDNGSPLVIIIDELDRCRPSFSVQMIEKIKHLFLVENIVFVLVLNKKQLVESIKCVYGEIDANTYLQKFINLEAIIPKKKEFHFSEAKKYSIKLIRDHGLSGVIEDQYQLAEYIYYFDCHFSLTLRQIEKIFTNICILHKSNEINFIRDVYQIAIFLCVIKVIDVELFEEISYGRINYSDLLERLKISGIDETHSLYGVMIWVRALMLSDVELKEQLEADPDIGYIRQELIRKNIKCSDLIPSLSAQLSMFVISS